MLCHIHFNVCNFSPWGEQLSKVTWHNTKVIWVRDESYRMHCWYVSLCSWRLCRPIFSFDDHVVLDSSVREQPPMSVNTEQDRHTFTTYYYQAPILFDLEGGRYEAAFQNFLWLLPKMAFNFIFTFLYTLQVLFTAVATRKTLLSILPEATKTGIFST